jgi:hypothetical protein
MGGFTTLWSNIRTAGLPNLHPVDLQSRCSILPGSPPLGLHQATALLHTHIWWDTCPSVVPAIPRRNTRLSWPMTTRIPTTSLHQTLALPLPPGHCPSGSAEPQPCVEWPEPTQPIRPCLAPAPCGTTGALSCWDRHHPGVRQPHPPACQETCSLCGAGPSSTGFPDNLSTGLLLGCH